MMQPSTNGAPVPAITAATRSTVRTSSALQSTNTGLDAVAPITGANRSAIATASCGGTTERMRPASAIAASSAATIPAASARARLAALRPTTEVTTRAPCSANRRPIALPMAPGARMAIDGGMKRLRPGLASAEPFACMPPAHRSCPPCRPADDGTMMACEGEPACDQDSSVRTAQPKTVVQSKRLRAGVSRWLTNVCDGRS